MKALQINEVPIEAYEEKTFINEIDINSKEMRGVLDGLLDYPEDRILEVLNSINDQNIQSIEMYAGRYTHRGQKLTFDQMATSEKVFLAALAANVSGKTIYLYRDLSSLTNETLKKFIRYFGKSEYVNIVYEKPGSKYFYEAMFKEAENGSADNR